MRGAGCWRDCRRPCAFYDLVGQGFRLERRTGANDMERVQYSFRVYFRDGRHLPVSRLHSRRHTARRTRGARRNRHRTDTCCHTPRWDQYLWIIGESGAIARPAMVGYAHNPEALKQIWLYILAPLIGAGVAGYLFRSGLLAAETVIPMRAKASRRCHPRRRHRVILGAGDARSSPQAVRAKNGSESIWRLPHSRKSPLWVKSGHQSGDGVGLLCAISRNREGCRAFIKNDPNGCSVMPRQ